MPGKTDELIRLALSLSWNRTAEREIIALADNFSSWPELFLQCLKEKICGSFYYLCEKNDILKIFPEKYKKKFGDEYTSIKGHNIFQLENLEKILRLFEDNNITVIILKGYSLLKNVYPSLGGRYPGDIDIVVKQKDVIPVKKMLALSGYKSLALYPDVLVKKGFLPIDLKTDLTGAERIKSRAFFGNICLSGILERSLAWDSSHVYAKIPSWEDHILILCSHAEKHSYSKISFFYDISRIFHKKSGEIDLERLKTKAFMSRVQKPFYVCLRYIKKNLFYPVENKLIEELEQEIRLSGIERKILGHVLSGGKLHIAGSLLPVFSIKGSRKKLIFIRELIFPSRDVLRQVTGIQDPKLAWAMYPVRIIQLTGEFFKALPKFKR